MRNPFCRKRSSARRPGKAQSDPAPQRDHIALNVAWAVIALAIAHAVGVALSWVLQRTKGRSAMVNDIDVLTRPPVRATLMVIATNAAVHHTVAAMSEWRGLVDHALLITGLATSTW
ncbi:hypothetical protein [Mycobacterium sp. 050134]|uniref:hypothetical protein n=1 Tax=Mycobacterium sp. 050134 TaxID=3096111 RepID=UPI002EDA506C